MSNQQAFASKRFCDTFLHFKATKMILVDVDSVMATLCLAR